MNEITPKEKKILRKMFWGSGLLFSGFNVVKMQGNGFTNAMGPAIEDLYQNDLAGKKDALLRSNGFFNTNNATVGLLAGLTYALEKEKVEKGTIDNDTIESMKVSLMGPSAAVGDAFVFNCLRVIVAGISIGIAKGGNIIGPLIFLILFGGAELLLRWYFMKMGFAYGTSFIDKIFDSGLLKVITNAASIVGLTMVGAMVATTVSVPIKLTLKFGEAKISFAEILDQIMPGILTLILLFFLMHLVKKGVKPIYLVISILVLSVILGFIGVF